MRVVLFSGTTEGRELSRRLAELGLEVTDVVIPADIQFITFG